MSLPTYKICVDWESNGNYTGTYDDITHDVIGYEHALGRDYASQVTGRAGPGQAIFTLYDPTGKYARQNAASPLYGNLEPGRKIRVTCTFLGVDYVRWTGEIAIPEPKPEAQLATIRAQQLSASLSAAKVNPAPVTAGALTGDLVDTVLDEAGWPAADRVLDAGQATTGPWYVADQYAQPALQDLEDTDPGFLYEDRLGRYVFEDRHHRLKGAHLVSQDTWSDAVASVRPYLDGIVEQDPIRDIYNRAEVSIENYDVAALAVLWTYQGDAPIIAPGETRVFVAEFPGRDAPDGAYVDAWTTPNATDITVTGATFANLTIGAVKSSNRMEISVTNGGAVAATLTLLQARGTAVSFLEPTIISAEDTASQAIYGIRDFRNPGPWLPDALAGLDYVNYIVSLYSRPPTVLSVPFDLACGDALATALLEREISDRVTIVATGLRTNLGINADFYIEAIHERVQVGTPHAVTFEVSPVLAGGSSGNFWILGTSLLGIDTYLGF